MCASNQGSSIKDRMFGIESEYAFAAIDPSGKAVERLSSVVRLVNASRQRLPHLVDHRDDRLFLENGACLYVDCGLHPEFATPECTTPWEAVRYVKAGERILASLAEGLEASGTGIGKAMLFRCNVDYSGAGTTWGCHESYLHKANPSTLCEQVLPHLVSRIVYTGAGGFDNRFPGIRFLISPRVPHLVEAVSDSSTSYRGIFHTKDEPLCEAGFHRLHVLAGESICSQTAACLKVGTTALVVAMVESGLQPGRSVALGDAVDAMGRFSADVECKAAARLANGTLATAIEIQTRYLEAAESCLGRDFMPEWASRVCALWRETLDQLKGAPDSVATTLDWAIKYGLYRAHIARLGGDADILATPLRIRPERRRRARAEVSPLSDLAEMLLGCVQEDDDSEDEEDVEHPHEDVAENQDSRLPGGLRPAALADELFAVDMRFGQLGNDGVFEALDRAGVLTHEIAEVGDIAPALSEPPTLGRARVRGECVKRLHGSGRSYHCSWDRVVDTQSGKRLDLTDPWCATEAWTSADAGQDPMVSILLGTRVRARRRLTRDLHQGGV